MSAPIPIPGTGLVYPAGDDASTWTADELLGFIHQALVHRDMRAVVYALRLLAGKDPETAQAVLDAFELTRLVKGGEDR